MAEVVSELRDAVGMGGVPELQPGSMAVSGTSVEGVVPIVSLGRQDSALFKRRANYRPVEPVLTDVGGIPISDDVAVPGSLAVSGAAIDGSTPKLDLGNHFSVSPASIPSTSEEDGSIISPASIFVRRQSSKTFNVESPVMGVTASQLEGKTTASVSLPSDDLLNQEAVPSSPAGSFGLFCSTGLPCFHVGALSRVAFRVYPATSACRGAPGRDDGNLKPPGRARHTLWGAEAPKDAYTLHPTPSALHSTPSTLHSTPYTLHPQPCILHPGTLFERRRLRRMPKPETLHPKPRHSL